MSGCARDSLEASQRHGVAVNQKELGWRNDAVGCFVGIGALCLEDVLDNGFSFVTLKHL